VRRARGRYSARVADDLNYSSPTEPVPPAPRRSGNAISSWLVAAVIVLVLAVAGGLLTAWIVASMRAVPDPGAVAFASPTPAAIASGCACTPTPGASADTTPGPRRTPTPLPSAEITPEPFVYVVEPGDHLVNIADQFAVDIQDLMDLNDITNPNKIFVGEQLLIPGYGIQPTPKPTKAPK
jgi:LysM domain-containing protein